MFNSDSNWLPNVGVVQIQTSFASQKEAIIQAIQVTESEMPSEISGSQDYESLKTLLEEGFAKFPQPVKHFDTSVGGSDVFNPYWQFCRNDDIVHPYHDISETMDGTKGLGSIYSEMIQDTQRVLWLSCGVPKFSGLSTFFLGDSSDVLGTIMKDGKPSISAAIGAIVGGTARAAFKIAFWPVTLSNFVGDLLTADIPVTKYYDFKCSMPLYFRLVDSIFCSLTVSMNLLANGDAEGPDSEDYVPEIVKQGCDIFAILRKRSTHLKDPATDGVLTGQQLLEAQAALTGEEKESKNGFKRFMSGFGTEASGINNFIGFRIEKSGDASESLSNETGESEIAGKLNSITGQQRSAMFTSQAGNTGIALFDEGLGLVKDTVEGVMSGAGLNAFCQMATGNGYFEIPHEWKGSRFTKNQSFSVQLRARYGDNITIAQDLYLPLCMWLAAGMPRGIGSNIYTAPFLVQAYCKGLFSIPLGMIESINIKRGSAEFGWNKMGLPLAIDLDITIKDLSPVMFLSLTDNEISIFNASVRNTAMLDYLSTLAGMGLYTRNISFHQMKNRFKAALLRMDHTFFSPDFWGMMMADKFPLVKGIYQCTPWRRGPDQTSPINNI